MKRNQNIFVVFFLCVVFLGCIVLLAKTPFFGGITGRIQHIFNPVESAFYGAFHGKKTFTPSELLATENRTLTEKFVAQDVLMKENRALKDQFQAGAGAPKSTTLLPARVIGTPGLWPGVSLPEALIINRGKEDHVQVGYAVVVGGNLIGKIHSVAQAEAKVVLLSENGMSFLVKTKSQDVNQKEALGVVKGMGSGEMLLDNVILSETVKPGDSVLTKGDVNENGEGFSPDLIVGKVIAVNKKASNLFQTAEVKSLVDPETLITVFVVIP